MSKETKIILGLATVWPILYICLFTTLMFRFAGIVPAVDGPVVFFVSLKPQWLFLLLALLLATIILGPVLAVAITSLILPN